MIIAAPAIPGKPTKRRNRLFTAQRRGRRNRVTAAYRYVTLNPAPARLVVRADDWPWSSARALLRLGEDPLTDLAPARQRFARFADRLEGPEDREANSAAAQG
jgi:hypothetical protein